MAFLDLTGLSRFLDKLKTIFALDSDVVHIAGDEEITGKKTYSSDLKVSKNTPVEIIQMLNLDTLQTSSTNQMMALGFYDKNGTTKKNRVGAIRSGMSSFDASSLELAAYSPIENSESYGSVKVFYPRNGTPYATAPSTPITGTANDIITRDYLDTKNYTKKREWSSTLMYSITLAEENQWYQSLNTIKTIDVTQYANSCCYGVCIWMQVPAATVAGILMQRVTFSDGTVYTYGINNAIYTAARYSTVHIENDRGKVRAYSVLASGNSSTSTQQTRPITTFVDSDAYITQIEVYMTTSDSVLPVGTKLRIYALKIGE